MDFRNKHENILIRKKFKKGYNYKCCGYKPIKNFNKFSSPNLYCCTYAMVYKRHDIKEWNKRMCRDYEIAFDELNY